MALSLLAASSPAYVPTVTPREPAPRMVEMSKEDLASALNPAIGDFDPLGLAQADFWGEGNSATYGFLRQAEIKHGRVAMFAFCGYIAQYNGLHFPYFLGEPTSGATPEEQWFNLCVATTRLEHSHPVGWRVSSLRVGSARGGPCGAPVAALRHP